MLSELIDRAAVGEEIVLARDGEPVAPLIPFESQTSPRASVLGALRGQIKIAPDFDRLPDDIARAFGAPKPGPSRSSSGKRH